MVRQQANNALFPHGYSVLQKFLVMHGNSLPSFTGTDLCTSHSRHDLDVGARELTVTEATRAPSKILLGLDARKRPVGATSTIPHLASIYLNILRVIGFTKGPWRTRGFWRTLSICGCDSLRPCTTDVQQKPRLFTRTDFCKSQRHSERCLPPLRRKVDRKKGKVVPTRAP